MLAKQREKKRYIETVANTSKSTSLDGSSQKTEKRVNERETQTTHPNVENQASVCETRRDTLKRWPVDGIGLSLGVSSRNKESSAETRKRERERETRRQVRC